MRTADYCRFSSDNQRDQSVEDQQRETARLAERYGLPAPQHFTDYGISGERKDRPGYVAMLAAAMARDFDVLLLWDLKRLSRASDLPSVLEKLKFWGVRVITCDGYDSEQDGSDIRGWVDAMIGNRYLKDLARATHRGQMGQALKGYSAGGKPYGYQPIAKDGGRGLSIVPEQAAMVVRIFEAYVSGRCPRDIAADLNRDGIQSQSGKPWAISAIYPDRRGIGILANPIYSGRQVWNRSRFIKDPSTGRRIRQERPRAEWVETRDEALRIVPEPLWLAAQARAETSRQRTGNRASQGGRPRYLFSGIVRCGVCGGPMSMIGRDTYGCTTRRDRGTCDNRLTVPRPLLETRLLAGIKAELLSDEAWKVYEREVSAALKQAQSGKSLALATVSASQKERDNIMAAIRQGIITPSTKAALEDAERKLTQARAELDLEAAYQPASFLPRARDLWRESVRRLEQIENVDEGREALRQIVGERIPLVPENGGLVAEITGERRLLDVVAGACFVLQQPIRIQLTGRGFYMKGRKR